MYLPLVIIRLIKSFTEETRDLKKAINIGIAGVGYEWRFTEEFTIVQSVVQFVDLADYNARRYLNACRYNAQGINANINEHVMKSELVTTINSMEYLHYPKDRDRITDNMWYSLDMYWGDVPAVVRRVRMGAAR